MVTDEGTRKEAVSLALRSLFWALAFPGLFAGYIPWRYFGVRDARIDWTDAVAVSGLACAAAGAALLAACIVAFARRGRGTLSPLDPPRQLVVRGLYRYVRNPMYLSVTMMLLGQALLTGSRTLAMYWAIWFAVVNLFLMRFEEPALRRQFGASYDEYMQRVGRWVPTLRPAAPGAGMEDGRGGA